MQDLELGNIMFNTNTNQEYKCPEYVIALLEAIEKRLEIVMHNIGERHYQSPFDNTAAKYKNNVFEVEAYSWDDDYEQPYNFKCDNVEISWYKYLGRDTTINGEYDVDYIIDIFNKCIKSLRDYEKDNIKE